MMSSSICFSSCFKTPIIDYETEHEDDDAYENHSSIVRIHRRAITTVRERIYATLVNYPIIKRNHGHPTEHLNSIGEY